MNALEPIHVARRLLVQAPSYLWLCLFWWLYPTGILRQMAAACPYPDVRRLMLRRSGIRLGRDVETNWGLLVLGRGRKPPAVEIGDRAALGPCVVFITSSYPGPSRLLQHPEVQRMIKRFAPIRVECDAWIGAAAVIMPGVTIGRGSIVGAGAVVCKDVEPYTVVAGVPARVIRRLSELSSASHEIADSAGA